MLETSASSRPFAERVLRTVRSIPAGHVASYGDVAAVCDSPRAARGVGAVLSGTFDTDVPWWRVVNRTGALTIPAIDGLRTLQRTLLESEGVTFDAEGRVRMDVHREDFGDETT
jgi:methylated-DNA-protein-cysteine methyltransferase-like protein